MTAQTIAGDLQSDDPEEPREEAHEIIWSATTVWVNDATGCCIGRFSPRGVDVHKSGPDQLADGAQCLDCIHDLPPRASWDRFVASMLHHHGVEVPAAAQPVFVRQAQA